jgi:hypothetical protein
MQKLIFEWIKWTLDEFKLLILLKQTKIMEDEMVSAKKINRKIMDISLMLLKEKSTENVNEFDIRC